MEEACKCGAIQRTVQASNEVTFKVATKLRHVYWSIYIDVSKTDSDLLWRGQESKKRLLDPEEITQILQTVDTSTSFDEAAYQLRRSQQQRNRCGFRGT